MGYYVYILFSKKLNRFYTGYTNDLDIRLTFHKHPESRKFTAKATDWVLFFKIECDSKKQALAIEKHIKKMKSKIYIQNLANYPEMVLSLKARFSDC